MADGEKTSRTPDDFMGLFSRHSLRIYGFVRTLVPAYQDASDIFQNTSVVLWKKFDDYEPDSDFFAWACQIARYEVLAHYRRGHRYNLFSPEVLDALATEVAGQGDMLDRRAEALGDCLEKLPAKDTRLIQDRYFRGRKVEEIAEAVSRSVSSVYRSLSRVHDQLFRCIERKLSSEV
jgi:RNA polymerase sigma-70 factor (ECF subfamily)